MDRQVLTLSAGNAIVINIRAQKQRSYLLMSKKDSCQKYKALSHDVGTSKGFFDWEGKVICLEAREKAALHYCQLCGGVPPVSAILYLVTSVGMAEFCSAISAALQ